MTTMTIKSRKLDQNLTFFMPDDGGYVRLEGEHTHGALGRQICDGGDFKGSTISSTPGSFAQDCRRWYRQRIRWMQSEQLC